MKLFPAIDLLGGKAVRLEQGDRARATVYHDRPHELCREFAAAGAERIHVVDLDGAFAGAPAHRDTVARIVAASPVPVQVGGGLRDRAALDAAFAAGAGFAVLGTAAVKDPAFAEAACRDHRGRVVIAVDARDGMVAVEGWAERTQVAAVDLARAAAGWGAAGLLYTDIARDGMHRGPNVDATAALVRALEPPPTGRGGVMVIASGGVSSLDDLRALAAAGIPAAVIGRALYDRRFTLAEAIAAVRDAAGGDARG